MNDNETTADVLAAMRDEGNTGESSCLEWVGAKMRHYADLLEAAHKRERENYDAKIADLQLRVKLWTDRSDELVKKCVEQYAKLKQVGNSAKLREALVQVQKKINYLIGNLTVPNSLVANRMEINGIINAALAAPPRNCDVIGNTGRALVVHGFPTKSNQWGEGEWLEFIDWLLAPVTEKKGDNDGNK